MEKANFVKMIHIDMGTSNLDSVLIDSNDEEFDVEAMNNFVVYNQENADLETAASDAIWLGIFCSELHRLNAFESTETLNERIEGAKALIRFIDENIEKALKIANEYGIVNIKIDICTA